MGKKSKKIVEETSSTETNAYFNYYYYNAADLIKAVNVKTKNMITKLRKLNSLILAARLEETLVANLSNSLEAAFEVRKVEASYKVEAINRRRFFVKKLLNFLSHDFTKSYTAEQIAKYLDADMEKVNYALTYLAEGGIINNREGLYGVAGSKPITSSHKETRMTSKNNKTSKKEDVSKKVEAKEEGYTLEELTARALRNFKEGKFTEL
jgi:hypothetical protein